jgi:hypothetical protein
MASGEITLTKELVAAREVRIPFDSPPTDFSADLCKKFAPRLKLPASARHIEIEGNEAVVRLALFARPGDKICWEAA